MIYHLILNLFQKGSHNFDDSLIKIALAASCASANVLKLMDANVKQWLKSQNELIQLKIACQHENAHQKMYAHELLKKCKNHAGPFTSIEELHNCVGENNHRVENLRLKILYWKHSSPKDAQLNPKLCKVNQMSLISMKVNFGILLPGNREEQIDADANRYIASIFPSESDIISAIENIADIQVESRDTKQAR